MASAIHMIAGVVVCSGLAVGVLAQESERPAPSGPLPTYSLEATEITASPGDILTTRIFVRDWSINGEKLRSFQVTMDSATFATGQSGKIEPVAMGVPDNKENAFIDEKDPRHIHRGMHTIPAVDTSTSDYRWLSVLYDEQQSPLSPMDGTKYSCATLRLAVSNDASGTFKIGFTSSPDLTMLINPANEKIEGLQLEPLIVNVAPATQWLRIRSSEPAGGSVDPYLIGKNDKACRWNSIRLSSSGDASSLTTSDFEVVDGTSNPPQVKQVDADREQPGTVVLHLNRGIARGRWTKVVHKPSQSDVRIGCLPGDVNNDAVLNGQDVTALIEVLNGERQLSLAQTDLNGDSKTTTADLVGLVDAVATWPDAGVRIAPLSER
jgi:hypothetical protein